MLKEKIENLRIELYNAILTNKLDKVLYLSQELDKLIVEYYNMTTQNAYLPS
ncbi:aspartyl-phosphate phosphatase Spo0E family protein [Caloramator proteoclasticus]|uniref:Spo0E like sporulation regulatory protein n=1 Tax=Caloramator proteoclasticus DSM 10124 TaxID=1121262 RepID=A0A1M4UCQ1_9CLOT|nr:aspartyl-phosphate phosphatase Spo0E family protein [Caloramator proteoclasticus]SHE54519.1 Spo0E like sporulation regulatory protein [Caloramator proteoclasticus DSM 10124]